MGASLGLGFRKAEGDVDESVSKKKTTWDRPDVVRVKPMLCTASKNFKEVSHCPSILSHETTATSTTSSTATGAPADAVVREDLCVPGSRCFLLHNLLSAEECRHYISETERVGYSGLSDLFPPGYRSSDRVLSICRPLAAELWRRLEPHLTRREVVRVRPIGFGNQGSWKPFRLNECCKFGRYKAGGHFSPHIDGPWVPRQDESSVFTVVVYLNSNFKGGATNFLDEDDGAGKVLCSVAPKRGTALVFNHDTLHEGQPVSKGSKYIIRTEIMYRRVDTEMLPNPCAYEEDLNYFRTLTLYQKSAQLEQDGDIEGFTDTYLDAIKMQAQAQRSVGADSFNIFEQKLPYDIYLHILSCLSTRDVCSAMQVCKLWYDLCMDGQVWYQLYRKRWPIGISLEAHVVPTCKHDPGQGGTQQQQQQREPGPFLKDWYGLYKQRVLMRQPKKVMIVDPGSHSFKCAVLNLKKSTIATWSRESVIAEVRGINDLHMRRMQYERVYSGKQARERFHESDIKEVVKAGRVVLTCYLPEILTCFYLDCNVNSKYTPVVILEPPGLLWDQQMKREIVSWFVTAYRQPSVTFLSSSVATLYYVNLTSGVVLDVGSGVVTCAGVLEGRELPGALSCLPPEASVSKLVDMVHTVTLACEESARVKLQVSIVITGGQAKNYKQELLEQLQKRRENTVIFTDDAVFGAVKGGAVFAALSDYQECDHRKSSSEYKDLHHWSFYNIVLGCEYRYWDLGLFHTKSELRDFFGWGGDKSNGERFCLSDSSEDEVSSVK